MRCKRHAASATVVCMSTGRTDKRRVCPHPLQSVLFGGCTSSEWRPLAKLVQRRVVGRLSDPKTLQTSLPAHPTSSHPPVAHPPRALFTLFTHISARLTDDRSPQRNRSNRPAAPPTKTTQDWLRIRMVLRKIAVGTPGNAGADQDILSARPHPGLTRASAAAPPSSSARDIKKTKIVDRRPQD
ncbi:hypothetical protein PhaeoP70_02290 [Phaeobacter inhibens]|nr:hypothetical protein PhaeoP92_02291 [Phaeobacter inhibens]AUQ78970.1 hypothetical protein PhaeoP74_02292 [Phaeobacter inhibens]AUR16129.1 hypothetical protein PhaeoP70_02290 [Phaeobacter inhibens]